MSINLIKYCIVVSGVYFNTVICFVKIETDLRIKIVSYFLVCSPQIKIVIN